MIWKILSYILAFTFTEFQNMPFIRSFQLCFSPFLFLVLFFGFSLIGCAGEKKNQVTNTASVDTLQVYSLDESEIRAAMDSLSMKQPVLINFWATWCKPCVEEFDDMVRIGKQAGDSLSVYFVSGDFDIAKAETFLNRKGITGWSGFKDGKDEPFINAVSIEWTGALPFTQLVYKGKVLDEWEAKLPVEELENRVQQAYQMALNP